MADNQTVSVKMCPCCDHEEATTMPRTITNGLPVDSHNRVLILCDDCKLLYGDTWDNY